MGAKPSTALAIAVVPLGLEEKMASALSQMMAGASLVLSQENCALVGGHSSEGDQLALGFSVTGATAGSDEPLLVKGGLKAGQMLILTKALGTGVLSAAEMRAKAKGTWVLDMWAKMKISNGPAVEVLRRHGCTALTDVSGFGLMGHLNEALEGSNLANGVADKEEPMKLGAQVWIDEVPVLEGAAECAAAGISSTVFPQNLDVQKMICNADAFGTHPSFELLFDPQTSGGLLASVRPDQAQHCLEELRQTLPDAAIIGKIEELGTGGDRCIKLV
mmetsp:Transcript_7273/g.10919  ORF Transcript_7273/g.10919 Transcript_7273/m.10919 type:complete len:275 (-) Transcript_7273:147-971(-)